MEARCQQFQTDAQRPRDAKTPKDIEKLRKFLFKNQEYRFADKEQTYLFQAVSTYANAYIAKPEPDSPALPLVEDALKMPFTVFSTSQKKSMIKLLDKLNGLESHHAADDGTSSGQQQQQQQYYTVLDVGSSSAEVMNDEGDTVDVDLAVCDPELVASLRRAFDAADGEGQEVCDELRVLLGTRHGKTAICKLLR